MSDKTRDLEKIIKYNFKNNSLLKRSLTHKSYDISNNNEKLEFLGDRVLGLIISQKLLEKFPKEKEGIIDKKFANLVNKKTCSSIARKLNLKKFIFLGKSHKNLERSADKIVGDCLEAIVGAIYLDGGLKVAHKFILSVWDLYLEKSVVTLIDSKTQLNIHFIKKLDLNTNHLLRLKCKSQIQKRFQELVLQRKKLNKMLLKSY